MTLSFIEIQAKDNPKIKHLRGLCEQANYRKKQQQTVLEGTHLIDAYLKSPHQPISAFYLTQAALGHPEVPAILAQSQGVPVYLLTDALYQDVRTLGPGIDIMAVIQTPLAQSALALDQDVLILENL
ncbi:MAG: RNA methyltransferase, partial [Moraxellaceae bacterium]